MNWLLKISVWDNVRQAQPPAYARQACNIGAASGKSLKHLRILYALSALACLHAAHAQTVGIANSPSTLPAPSIPACCTATNGTLVDLELVDALSSKVQKRGDTFHLKLSTPLVVAGKRLLPADVEGMGEIIDAAPAGVGGAPGKMLVAARYLSWNGTRIPLRGTKLGGAGKSNAQAALAVGIVMGPLGMFVHGGNIIFPPGTHIEAKLATDILLAPLPDTVETPATLPDSTSPAGAGRFPATTALPTPILAFQLPQPPTIIPRSDQ